MNSDTVEASDEPSTSSSTVNRRKAVFRQPLPVQHSHRVDSSMSVYSAGAEERAETDGEMALDMNSPMPNDNKKRKANPWSFDEVCAFYEGVKQHGKDFDGVMKAMAKRKVEKTKEHVKTFFYNSVKTYKAMLSLTDDHMASLSKDARELFILVNACEWKRKTMNMKVNIEKLRELLFDGVTNVKVGRRMVNIKTPPCPALCRYFSSRKVDKIPSELYVHLEPMRNEDHFYMRRRDHNPFLRVKLNANDRISKLLDFLHRKWAGNEESAKVSITLWPDSSCEVASLNIHTVEASPFISISMNKLKKHLEEAKEKVEPPPVKKPLPNTLQTAAEVNTKTKPSLTVFYPKPFNLTDGIIAEGITMQNIMNSIVAELFCVCGRKSPIQLRYQIHYEPPPNKPADLEPWKLMIQLLNRGYGESLTHSRREEGKDKRREIREAASREPANKKKKTDGNNTPSQAPCPQSMTSDIVERENEAFENQLAMLRKTQRQRIVSMKRKKMDVPIISTGTPPISVRPSVTSPTPANQNFAKPFAAPTCTVIMSKQRATANAGRGSTAPKKIYRSAPSTSGPIRSGPSGASTSGTSNNPPTDFSSVVFSPAKKRVDDEIQRKRTADFLSSLQTPTDTPLQTPNRQRAAMMQQLFGDDLSMSPNSTRHASMLEVPEGANKDTSVVDFTDMMFQHISTDQGEMTMTNPGLDFSVSEVQQTYQDMMSSSQDSHDFIFQQFQKKKFTPKKKL